MRSRRVLRRPRLLIAALPLCLGLMGCAGLPKGVLTPVEVTVPRTSRVSLLVATTRAPSSDRGILFSGERGDALQSTELTVSIPPPENRQVGQVQWPKQLPPNPVTDFATTKVRDLSSPSEIRGWVKQNLPRSRRVLIFVHGFNNRYEDAVYRFAQIVHDSRTDVAPILFTWPSRGNVLDYAYDRESTNYSRTQLEEVLRQAARDPLVGEVTIMAHSMGSWLVVEALRQMAIRDGRVAPTIRSVILASPDIDVQVFRKQWLELGTHRPQLTLFVSQDDKALDVSRLIGGAVDRLGQINPAAEPYRSELEKAGVTVLDLTALKGGDPLNHGKFAERPEVVRLLGERLVAGQVIADGKNGSVNPLGTVAAGAAQTVEGAASLIRFR
ncbi:alpha/beta fold hydrolase [Bosea sp. F3-2]|nr:alpha/beta fold hydrolase [Bosea sp. F3-2]